ncbi:SpaA isopeptide-forming pilin-related protein [Pseudoramibacter porci]|uniref:SpaA-like prealbumin fold domain-containing protein n=1 Tax=Pseudoramibacter porci TaxID=2606631 RepID=A0A7X2TAR6_9FIRM|nr:SpaA isopeptide-forming pilin-related protein [Pseudoramibacter porci]MSS20395.1 hypothetical protein [Pseudoramibacter porci]
MMERAGKDTKRVVMLVIAVLAALCVAGIVAVRASEGTKQGTPQKEAAKTVFNFKTENGVQKNQAKTWNTNEGTTYTYQQVLDMLNQQDKMTTDVAVYANQFTDGMHLEGNVKVGMITVNNGSGPLNQNDAVIRRNCPTEVTVELDTGNKVEKDTAFKMAICDSQKNILDTFSITVKKGEKEGSCTLKFNDVTINAIKSGDNVSVYQLDDKGKLTQKGEAFQTLSTIKKSDFTNYIGTIKMGSGVQMLDQNFFDQGRKGYTTYIENMQNGHYDGANYVFESGDNKITVKDYQGFDNMPQYIQQKKNITKDVSDNLTYLKGVSAELANAKNGASSGENSLSVINLKSTTGNLKDDLENANFLEPQNGKAIQGILNEDGYLLINIDTNGQDTYTLEQIQIDNLGADSETEELARHIIYNFVQKGTNGKYEAYTGNIRINNVAAGQVLAPAAQYKHGGGLRGAVIADSVDFPQGPEIHRDTLSTKTKAKVKLTLADQVEETGSLKLTKISEGHETPENATFTITKEGETKPTATVTYRQMEGKGSFTVDLPIGTYNVKESGADVDGYTLKVDGTTTATVETGKTAEISLTNTYSKDTGSLTFTKKTAGDAQTPDSTQFTIKGPSGVVYQGTYGDLKKSDGSVTINGLEVGEYTVEETGEKVDNYQVTVTGDKQATVFKGQKANITLTNTYTKEQSVKGALRLRKQSKNGATIAGTTYTLYKWNGTDASQIGTVTRDQIEKTNKDQWTQEEESKKTDAHGVYTSKELDAGSTYAVMETEATDGYQRTANPAVFTVDTKGQVSLIQNANADGAAEIDKDGNMVWHETSVVLKVTKIDQNNKPVEGATLALYDGNKEIERWTTNGEAHQIATSLTAGKTYTLKEIDVPEGYEKAVDQTITIEKKDAVGKTENIQSVSMTDQKKTTTPITLKVSKTDLTSGKEVSGAKITVYDENNKAVDSWTSDGTEHDFGSSLKAGSKYTIKEDGAPAGYDYINTIKLSVGKDGKMTVTGTEGDFKYDAKTGKLTIQDKKLATKKYALKVRKTENIDKKDTNKRIRGSRYAMFRWTGQIAAADAQDNALLGASLRVSNVATTAAADQKDPYARFRDLTRADIMKAKDWKMIGKSDTDSKGEIEKSDNDITPGVYAVMEEVPPAGYQRTANPAIIRLKEDGTKKMISNANGAAELETEGAVQFLRWRETATNVEIAKVDENGKPVKGAILAVYDKDGKLIESWTSDGTKHRITAKLVAGETYTLKELKAPEGYEKAADETFKVEEKDIVGIDQYVQDGINMTDKKTTTTTTTTNNNKTQTIAQGVKTGDPTTIGGLIALIAAAGAVTVLTVKRLRDAE